MPPSLPIAVNVLRMACVVATSFGNDSGRYGASPVQIRDKIELPRCPLCFLPNFKPFRALNYRQSDLQETIVR